jgi:hypothetical protein
MRPRIGLESVSTSLGFLILYNVFSECKHWGILVRDVMFASCLLCRQFLFNSILACCPKQITLESIFKHYSSAYSEAKLVYDVRWLDSCTTSIPIYNIAHSPSMIFYWPKTSTVHESYLHRETGLVTSVSSLSSLPKCIFHKFEIKGMQITRDIIC